MKSKSVAAGIESSGPDVSKSDGSRPQLSSASNHQEILQRAYEIYIWRGSEHGQDVNDWLQAERELTEMRRAV
jgi:uncharacterized protein YcfL